MANEKDNQQNDKNKKPASNANAQPVPENAANTANYKGPQDLGTDGTDASASQQQGQGAWNKNTDSRNGSRNSGGGQGGNNKTGEPEK
ncbi:MAG: hypothetical protein LPJ89_01730 [Hymenobacteraceae bacterium]|nr:hypothetical protein [Hymenobacteraceae bacterium]MDX5397888.1 hypothetical protein [Hymenobacteraceae bacterium]MDX5442483.1 hypothetical protein [Hymenobacteraceae bacterium]MDX5513959.1 hypothetical protein [Hymenobacteraceae bacterium]